LAEFHDLFGAPEASGTEMWTCLLLLPRNVVDPLCLYHQRYLESQLEGGYFPAWNLIGGSEGSLREDHI